MASRTRPVGNNVYEENGVLILECHSIQKATQNTISTGHTSPYIKLRWVEKIAGGLGKQVQLKLSLQKGGCGHIGEQKMN